MLLTGRYMHNVGIYSNGGAPSLNFTLLPDRLKQASPSLRAVMIGKWYNLIPIVMPWFYRARA